MKHLPPGLPFPSDLVESITQDDIDMLCQTMHTDMFPLGFHSAEPLCYAWIALQYFAVNAGAIGMSYDICGTPGNLHHGFLNPETATEISRRLRSYAEDGVRTPAIFFLCANADSPSPAARRSETERSRQIRNSRKPNDG